MPRFERRNQFWEISQTEVRYTIRHGAIGSDGAALEKVYRDIPACTKAVETEIKKKLRDGYRLVGAKQPRKAKPAAGTAYPPALEVAILDHPDDTSAREVLADWIEEQGGARGELVALQRSLGPDPDAKGKSQLAKFLAGHEAELLGDFDRSHLTDLRLVWQLGVIVDASLMWRSGPLVRATEPELCAIDWAARCRDQLARFLQLPAARFLRRLTLAPPPGEHATSFAPLAAVLEQVNPPALDTVYMHVPSWFSGSWQEQRVPIQIPVLPRVRYLSLIGGEVTGTLDLPALEGLHLHGILSSDVLAMIAKATLPKLESLVLAFQDPDSSGHGSASDFAPILKAKFPKLTALAIRDCRFSDRLVGDIAKSKLLGQLTSLGLERGNLTDRGIATIAKVKSRFAHLEELNLEDNMLTKSRSGKLANGLAQTVNWGSIQKRPRAD